MVIVFREVARANTNTTSLRSLIGKQLFFGILVDYKSELYTIEYVYRGIALKIDFNGYSLFLISIHSYKPLLPRDTLSVSSNNGHVSVKLSILDRKLHPDIDYKKDSSRRAVTRLKHRFRHTDVLKEIVSIEEPSRYSIDYELPVPSEPYVIALPLSKKLLEYTVLNLAELPTITVYGEFKGIILGFRGVYLELLLDMPIARDVVDYIVLDTNIKSINP